MAILEKVTNLARTTLSGSMPDGSGTSLTVTSASLFPSSGQFRIRIQDEILLVTAGAGTTSWTVSRAQEGTTGVSHPNSTMVYLVVTAGTLEHITQAHDHTGSVDGLAINFGWFGDGSDGDVTISADTTLTRNMFYNNLTVNSTKNLIGAGYIIFVKGTLTNNGIIHNNGGNAAIGSVGTAGLTGFFRGGSAGGSNAASSAVADGMGGQGGTTSAWAAGAVTAPTYPPRSLPMLFTAPYNSSSTIAWNAPYAGGSGGGGGNNTNSKGGGGAGVMMIFAKTIVNSGTISCKGGNDYYSSGIAAGGGGGGFLVIGYRNATWGTESVAGGTSYTGAYNGAAGNLWKFGL